MTGTNCGWISNERKRTMAKVSGRQLLVTICCPSFHIVTLAFLHMADTCAPHQAGERAFWAADIHFFNQTVHVCRTAAFSPSVSTAFGSRDQISYSASDVLPVDCAEPKAVFEPRALDHYLQQYVLMRILKCGRHMSGVPVQL